MDTRGQRHRGGTHGVVVGVVERRQRGHGRGDEARVHGVVAHADADKAVTTSL